MEQLKRALLLAVVLFVVQRTFAAQNAPASIEGVVMDLVTGVPVSKVTLDLQSSENPSLRYPGITSPDGRFIFRGVAPGRYSLTAMRTGYVRSQYGQRGPNGNATTLTISAGQRVADLRMSMVQSGSISGRLTDTEGEPVTEAQVHAWKVTYVDGWRVLEPIVSMASNDLGEYRMFGLPPGQYYVSAQAEPPDYIRTPSFAALGPPMPGAVMTSFSAGQGGAGAPDPAVQGRRALKYWSPVYFGGTTDQSAATPIPLPAGNEVRNADIAISRVPMLSISGKIVDASTGAATRNARLLVTPIAPVPFTALKTVNVFRGRISLADSQSIIVNANGDFVGANFPRGRYLLIALDDVQGKRASGQATVDLRQNDAVNTRISLVPARDLSGHVVFEGEPGPVRVGLRSMAAAEMDIAQQDVPSTGAFTLRNITASDYLFNVSLNGVKSYVKSIQLGTVDLLEEGVRASGLPDGEVRIVIGNDAGALRGNAVDDNGAPMSNVTVVLMPDENHRNRIDLYQSVATDATGGYRFDRVPPGAYKVFAWEDVEKDAWRNPSFMRLHESRGQAIQVGAGTAATVNTAVVRLR